MKQVRRAMISLAVANGLLLFGYGLSLPFFTVYLISQKGLSAAMTGLIIALSAFSRSFASALAGELSDAFGRKRLMICGLTIEIIVMMIMALCIQYKAAVGWVLLFYFLTTFWGAVFRPVSNAWVSDKISPQQRVEAFGFIRIGINLGWALGPAVGGFLVRWSYSYAFYLTALACAGVIYYLDRIIPDDSAAARAAHRRPQFLSIVWSLKDKRLSKICWYVLLITAVNSQLMVGLSVHCNTYLHMPENYIGWFFTINGLAVVFLQYHASRLMVRMRLTSAMLLGCVLYAVGYGSVGFFGSFTPIAFGVLLAALGELIVSPGEQTLVSNIASAQTRGRYLGLLLLFYNMGSSLGFFAAGWLGQYVAPLYLPGPWLIVGVVALLAGWGFYMLKGDLSDEENGRFSKPAMVEESSSALH